MKRAPARKRVEVVRSAVVGRGLVVNGAARSVLKRHGAKR